MWSFLGGEMIADGIADNNPVEEIAGALLVAADDNPSSALGGMLFEDGVRHHNVGEEIAGLAIGVAGAMSASPPRHHHHHHHHHHSPRETTEERAARLRREAALAEEQAEYERNQRLRKEQEYVERVQRDRERREAEQRARILAEENARAERELQAERQRQRAKLEREREEARLNQEFADEQARIANFKAHQNLIVIAQVTTNDKLHRAIAKLKPLASPIPRFEQSPYQGFPQGPLQTTVFSSIFNNPQLTGAQKTDAIARIYSLGYEQYHQIFLLSPLLEAGLRTREFFPTLLNFYKHYLSTRDTYLSLDAERSLWPTLISLTSHTELMTLMVATQAPVDRLFQFGLDWINSHKTYANIRNAYENIINLTQVSFFTKTHRDLLYKAAKQRILTLEADRVNQPGQSSGEDVVQTRVFLSQHRLFQCCGCHKTTSEKLWNNLHGDKQIKATEQIGKEQTQLDTDIAKLMGLRR